MSFCLCHHSAMLSSLSLILAAALFSFTATAGHAIQMPLFVSEAESVPGENNATFCTVPRSEQLFHVNFPTSLLCQYQCKPLTPLFPACYILLKPLLTIYGSEQIFFTYLRGWLSDNVTGLEDAKLYITCSAELASGEQFGPLTYAFQLATYAADDVTLDNPLSRRQIRRSATAWHNGNRYRQLVPRHVHQGWQVDIQDRSYNSREGERGEG